MLALPVLTTAAFALTVALDLATPPSGPGRELAPGYGWSYALLGPLLGGLATVILVRDVRQGWGWALAWLGVFWALDGLTQSYVRFGIRPDDALPGENLALWFLNRFGAFLPVTVAVLLMIFPTGRFLEGRWGRACQAALALMVVSVAAAILAPTGPQASGIDPPPGVDVDAFTVPALGGLADRAIPLAVALSIAGLGVAMASVVARHRVARGLERERMRWLLWSVVAMALVIVLGFVVHVRQVQDLVIFCVALLPAAAMTVGIVDPRLVSIEDLLGRTLVLGALAVVLLGVDLLAVAALAGALGDSLTQGQVVTTVLLVSAVLYAPLRSRLAAWVRRLLLGGRDNPYDVVAGLAASLETADEGPAQLAAVARAVATAFGVGFVSVEVDRAAGERLVATYGEPPRETRSLPIAYRGVEVGRLVLPARGLRSRLGRRDEQLLGDLVRQAATAARTSRLAEELQDSRERLVAAREEERRRIRRDLHDGLGPALSGVVFRLESARLRLDRDPEAARADLAATREQVQEVVADVRRLVHELRPPALDDLGLAGALRQQADRLTRDGLVVRVEADDLGALPAAAEVAAYRIAAEALTNVVRHAAAATATVRVRRRPGELVVEVRDDGSGIDERAQAGVGLLSLRERAAELGGRSEVTCPPGGGTLVRAWLPTARPDAGSDAGQDAGPSMGQDARQEPVVVPAGEG